MSYEWWVLVHLVGVFAFLASHGVSIAVALRLREERNPARINALLDLSGRTVAPFYVSLVVLLIGGIVAAFLRHWWSFGWVWAGLGTLVLVSLAMFAMARPYYQRVRFITRALADGSQAVSAEQFDSVLRGRRPITVIWMGFAGLAFILYLMILKPSLGISPSEAAVPTPAGVVVRVVATNSQFTAGRLTGPAGVAFSIRFQNKDSFPHNVSIYTDSSAARSLFVGERFGGPATRVYSVPALAAGTYFFRCDVHPTSMTGVFLVE